MGKVRGFIILECPLSSSSRQFTFFALNTFSCLSHVLFNSKNVARNMNKSTGTCDIHFLEKLPLCLYKFIKFMYDVVKVNFVGEKGAFPAQ